MRLHIAECYSPKAREIFNFTYATCGLLFDRCSLPATAWPFVDDHFASHLGCWYSWLSHVSLRGHHRTTYMYFGHVSSEMSTLCFSV